MVTSGIFSMTTLKSGPKQEQIYSEIMIHLDRERKTFFGHWKFIWED